MLMYGVSYVGGLINVKNMHLKRNKVITQLIIIAKYVVMDKYTVLWEHVTRAPRLPCKGQEKHL